MAVTSNWEWLGVDRGIQTSMSGSTLFTREQWTLRRKRISDDVYVDELGDSASSLAGENGGITETITAPTLPIVTFSANTNWTTTATQWMESGFSRNGHPVYLQYDDITCPVAGFKSAIQLVPQTGTTVFRWGVIAHPAAYIDRNAMAVNWGSSSDHIKESSSGAAGSIHGAVLDTTVGVYFSGAATATLTAAGALSFRCVSDNQVYDQRFVDWFSQVQIWTYEAPWQVGNQ